MGAIGAGAGYAVGAGLGELLGGGAAAKARRRALLELQGINEEAGPSAYEDLRTDPALRNAQIAAARRLASEGAEGGLGIQSRVALNESAGDMARRERGGREAILQQMAMRGAGGSGASLAAQLQNQQGSADRNAAFGARAAADARQRALAATAQSGEFAGGIRGQDWGEGAQKAGALDALSRFNASQRLTKGGMVYGGRMTNANADAEHWNRLAGGTGYAAGSVYDAWDARKKKPED